MLAEFKFATGARQAIICPMKNRAGSGKTAGSEIPYVNMGKTYSAKSAPG
jgi:hypothetical protein